MIKKKSNMTKLAGLSFAILILLNPSFETSIPEDTSEINPKPIMPNEIYCDEDIDIMFFEDYFEDEEDKDYNKDKDTKLIEKFEEIEFQTTFKEDKDLALGKEVIGKKGSQGEHKVIYEETYINGDLSKVEEVSRTIVKVPSDRIVYIGVNPFVKSETDEESGSLPNNYVYEYLSEYEDEMLEIINKHRVVNGVNPLARRRELDISARYKSLSMLQLDYFGHGNPQFKDDSFSYLMTNFLNIDNYSTLGENLAYKSSKKITINSLEDIFSALKESSGHNENMLNNEYEFIGIGIVYSSNPGLKYERKPTITITNHFGK